MFLLIKTPSLIHIYPNLALNFFSSLKFPNKPTRNSLLDLSRLHLNSPIKVIEPISPSQISFGSPNSASYEDYAKSKKDLQKISKMKSRLKARVEHLQQLKIQPQLKFLTKVYWYKIFGIFELHQTAGLLLNLLNTEVYPQRILFPILGIPLSAIISTKCSGKLKWHLRILTLALTTLPLKTLLNQFYPVLVSSHFWLHVISFTGSISMTFVPMSTLRYLPIHLFYFNCLTMYTIGRIMGEMLSAGMGVTPYTKALQGYKMTLQVIFVASWWSTGTAHALREFHKGVDRVNKGRKIEFVNEKEVVRGGVKPSAVAWSQSKQLVNLLCRIMKIKN